MLGISVPDLRLLVRTHITQDDESALPAKYRPADLVALRFLAGIPAGATLAAGQV